jgi:GH15 family glucan-1,4-alpha-glucosidase
MQNLDLALVGNGAVAALIDSRGTVNWLCLPTVDGDPVFCSLLRGSAKPEEDGGFQIEMVNTIRTEQNYLAGTPILETKFFDAAGSAIRVTDFAPRLDAESGVVAPPVLVRRIERLEGAPLVRVRVRPMAGYGKTLLKPQPVQASASDGGMTGTIRFSADDLTLRLTTDAPVDAIANETPFPLEDAVTFLLVADTEITTSFAADYLQPTIAWWTRWAGALTKPNNWQAETLRAAITLKLNVIEETGAIIAAVTTSIPESPDSGRNWDYRYCWLRDSYFVVAALQRLGDNATTDRYVDFLLRVLGSSPDGRLKPMYSITAGAIPDEEAAPALPGYRDMGPVRIGNLAYLQVQHDAYGEVILAARPLFFGDRLDPRAETKLFAALEKVGDQALAFYDQPDAGLWELRGKERVHTFSSVMCWAACDALADIAAELGLPERAEHWRKSAERIRETINRRSWNAQVNAFTAAMEGDSLDAALLLMHKFGFIEADDPRFAATVHAIGRDLKRGELIYRYVEKDDFGEPENAFLVCTLWYVEALAAIGEIEEARRVFAIVLSHRNRHGLLAEHVDPRTGEQWGNFVQTYSMAGIIDAALLLSGK